MKKSYQKRHHIFKWSPVNLIAHACTLCTVYTYTDSPFDKRPVIGKYMKIEKNERLECIFWSKLRENRGGNINRYFSNFFFWRRNVKFFNRIDFLLGFGRFKCNEIRKKQIKFHNLKQSISKSNKKWLSIQK